MMKKNIYSKLMLAVLIAVTCIGFTACSSSDDDDEPVAVTWSTSYNVEFELSDDVLKAADVTAHIANPDGTFREERVSRTNPAWTLTGNSIPDKAGVLLTFVPKQNIDETDVYDIGIKGSIAAQSYKDKGLCDYKSFSGSSHLTIQGDKVSEYFVGNGVAFAYGVNTEGTIVSVDADEFDFGLNGFWKWVAGFFVDGKK